MIIIVYSIAILGIYMSAFLFFFFLFTPKGNKIENRILAILIIVFGFQIFMALALGTYGYKYFLRPHLYIYSLKLTCFTSGPLFYFYLKYFFEKCKPNKFSYLHFIPFICSLIFYGYFKFDIRLIGQTSVIIHSLCLFQNLFYISFSIYYIKKNNIPIKQKFRDFKDFSLLNWMKIILFGYITIWMVQLNSFSIYVILSKPDWCAYTSSILYLTILIFTILIMLLLLLKPDIYFAIKGKNNNLGESLKDECLQKIDAYFNLKKPYLNPDISLEKVAAEISINPRTLSQLINAYYKMNFKSFVNDFRIKECLRLFYEDAINEKTIQEVYYMSGFNSKSVFYELFKTYTGFTPKEYKEKQKELTKNKTSENMFSNN